MNCFKKILFWQITIFAILMAVSPLFFLENNQAAATATAIVKQTTENQLVESPKEILEKMDQGYSFFVSNGMVFAYKKSSGPNLGPPTNSFEEVKSPAIVEAEMYAEKHNQEQTISLEESRRMVRSSLSEYIRLQFQDIYLQLYGTTNEEEIAKIRTEEIAKISQQNHAKGGAVTELQNICYITNIPYKNPPPK
jgi:hypothetical protein